MGEVAHLTQLAVEVILLEEEIADFVGRRLEEGVDESRRIHRVFSPFRRVGRGIAVAQQPPCGVRAQPEGVGIDEGSKLLALHLLLSEQGVELAHILLLEGGNRLIVDLRQSIERSPPLGEVAAACRILESAYSRGTHIHWMERER